MGDTHCGRHETILAGAHAQRAQRHEEATQRGGGWHTLATLPQRNEKGRTVKALSNFLIALKKRDRNSTVQCLTILNFFLCTAIGHGPWGVGARWHTRSHGWR